LSFEEKMTRQILSIAVVALLAFPAFARIGWYPDFDELSQKSDAVVVAEDLAVHDLPETSVLPNIHPDIKVVGVETTFKVVARLKGTTPDTLVLHHYRLPTAQAHGHFTMMSGPGLVMFLGDHQRYLMFLNKEADGRYVPGSGQTDPNCSIRPIGNEMWTFERGNVFIPVLKSLLFWLFLVIVLPLALLVCAIIYLKKRKKLNEASDATSEPAGAASSSHQG
jgi:hypothetical protein